jgi:hypothetical protein
MYKKEILQKKLVQFNPYLKILTLIVQTGEECLN